METSEVKTGIKSGGVREIFRPEVLVSLESFLKIFRNAYVGFCVRKIICIYLAVLYVEFD